MKANTVVHAAFRNIGDSQDEGKFFEGALRETIVWLATQLAATTLAQRVAIGIGRTQNDAALAINSSRAGKTKLSDSMKQTIDELFETLDFDDDDSEPSASPAVNSLDSYKGV